MAHLTAVKRRPSDRGRLGVGVAPTRDHQAMTDDEVLNEARADGFELVERLATFVPWAACATALILRDPAHEERQNLPFQGGAN
jgi:hypothetical protein